MCLKRLIPLFLATFLAWVPCARAQGVATFALREDGTIPAWITAGPFDLGTVGFGEPRDFDVIGEMTIRPSEGDSAQTSLLLGGQTTWDAVSVDVTGYLDLMEAVSWKLPSDRPEQIWKARAAYAFTYVDAPRAMDVVLRTGSNSGLKVMLNGETVFHSTASRNAVADSDSIRVALREGRNALLMKVTQTQANEAPDFFRSLEWQWGFYARLTSIDGGDLSAISVSVPSARTGLSTSLRSTFYFAGMPDSVLQRFDVVVDSPDPEVRDGKLTVSIGDATEERQLLGIRFGKTRHPVWLPAVSDSTFARIGLTVGGSAQVAGVWLLPQPRYEIHLAMMAHTDIGYTGIQPLVAERHVRTLDDVIARCEADSTFRWTIETVWQLEQYESGRPPSQFQKLIDLIRSGRIAVSPIYTNPFTGWVGNDEFYRSFDPMNYYREKYGIRSTAAVYNDTPGLSWLLPQALESEGVHFLATGINEIYGGYTLQKALPKAFMWEGPGGGRVLTYRNEAYNEAQQLGLEKGLAATENKLWERLHRLQAQGYAYDLILAIHTFGDNGPIPMNAAPNARLWDSKYLWPKFVIGNIEEFGQKFEAKYGSDVPTLYGDWTSNWDVLYQGEASRMVRQRWSQYNLPSAEKAATIAWMLNPEYEPMSDVVERAYDNMLHFDGHGSGLEYGYGSPRDNILSQDYREQYVEDARLETVEVQERALYRLAIPEESFEGEGLFLFNPLNWSRDAVLEFEFTRENGHGYKALDMASGDELLAYFSGYTLRVIVPKVPALGYKKIRLVAGDPSGNTGTDLMTDGCSIENAYYRIEADCASGIRRIVVKETGEALSDDLFAAPAWSDSLFSMRFEPVSPGTSQAEVIDERPARLILRIPRAEGLYGATEVSLWGGLDYVNVSQTIDLEALPETDIVQDYSLAFGFDLSNPQVEIDAAGGFLDPSRDRFPGIDHDAYAVRRGVSLTDGTRSVDWVSLDGRVVRVRKDEQGKPVIYANLTNNFPEHWNRWEEKEGTLTFRFAVRGRKGGFDSTAAARFGWERTVPVAGRYTWLRSANPEKSYMTVDGDNVVLLSMRRSGDGLEMRLMNTSQTDSAIAAVTSDLFEFKTVGAGQRPARRSAQAADLSVGAGQRPVRPAAATVELAPGEIRAVNVGFSR